MKKTTYKKCLIVMWLPIALVFIYIVSGMSTFPRYAFAQKDKTESAKDILIIVNKSSPVNNISMDDLVDLFLKRRRTFGNGTKATPINAKNSALRNDFRRRVINKTSTEEKEYWQTHRIRTGEFPPVTFANPLKAVFKLRNGIGYIYRSEMIEGVAKIIRVIPAN